MMNCEDLDGLHYPGALLGRCVRRVSEIDVTNHRVLHTNHRERLSVLARKHLEKNHRTVFGH